MYSTIEETICSGTSFEFNGKQYSKTGVYVDTLSSLVTGCDSIAKLILTVNAPLTETVSAYICPGTSYYFTPNYPALTVGGTYQDNLKTAEGCDSIVTLTLTVIEADTARVSKTIKENELPYSYPNTSIYYPVGTKVGTYMDTVTVVGEKCEYTLIHTLTIEAGQGIESVEDGTLQLLPNIISVGESVTATNGVGSGVVRVFDAVGRCVKQESITGTPVVIDGFYTAGLYTVHITTEQGQRFVGRVLVK